MSPPTTQLIRKRTCDICYNEYPDDTFFGLSCSHDYCQECLSDHLSVNIYDGNVVKIPCMMVGCNQSFEANDVRRFGAKEIYEKYLQFKMNIDVALNPKLKWCPRRGCMRYV